VSPRIFLASATTRAFLLLLLLLLLRKPGAAAAESSESKKNDEPRIERRQQVGEKKEGREVKRNEVEKVQKDQRRKVAHVSLLRRDSLQHMYLLLFARLFQQASSLSTKTMARERGRRQNHQPGLYKAKR